MARKRNARPGASGPGAGLLHDHRRPLPNIQVADAPDGSRPADDSPPPWQTIPLFLEIGGPPEKPYAAARSPPKRLGRDNEPAP